MRLHGLTQSTPYDGLRQEEEGILVKQITPQLTIAYFMDVPGINNIGHRAFLRPLADRGGPNEPVRPSL